MAEGKNLKATGEAADAVGTVISYDFGEPSGAEMSQVSGVRDGPAADYAEKLSMLGGEFANEFRRLLERVRQDASASKLSIEQMQGLDEEIASALNGLAFGDGSTTTTTGGSSAGSQWG